MIKKVVKTTFNFMTGEKISHELDEKELKKWKKEHGIKDDSTKKKSKSDT